MFRMLEPHRSNNCVLNQSLSQSFTDRAEWFSCISHCHNPLQIEQNGSAASVTVTILHRPSRMVQLYQSLSQSSTDRIGWFSCISHCHNPSQTE